MAEAPTVEFGSTITELADKLVNLSVKDAQALVDCLKSVHGIEPADGGVVMAAGAGDAQGAAEVEEKTSFDVILAGGLDPENVGGAGRYAKQQGWHKP